MSWLHHPRYVPVRDALVARLRHSGSVFGSLRPIVFLCGGHDSRQRDRVREYLLKQHPEWYVFYAEDAWSIVARGSRSGSLQMEAELAKLADVVIIIVESAGTIAELGAFAMDAKLRQKLLPMVDVKFQGENSFINTGPLHWVDNDSNFKPTIYGSHRSILQCADDLDSRLTKLRSNRPQPVSNLPENPKHFLFFILDLFSVIGPAPTSVVSFYTKEVIGQVSETQVEHLVALGSALGLLREITTDTKSGKNRAYYSRTTPDALEATFQLGSRAIVPSERAKQLSVLQTIDEFRAVVGLN